MPVTTKDEILLEMGRDPVLMHRTLFRHRHTEETKAFHQDIARDWHSDHPKVLTEMFRGGGKSTEGEECFITDALYRQFNYALVIGANEDRAKERLTAIKHELEYNDYIQELFGDLQGAKWQETFVELSNGVIIRAYGCGQALRGAKHLHYRPDMVFIDDLEDEESVLNEANREKTRQWFFGTLLPALHPRARIRIAGTPLHPEALLVKLAQDPSWKVHKVPLLIKDEDGNDVSVWPERFPTDWCLEKRESYAKIGQTQIWNQEYMCEAEDVDAKIFTSDLFRYEPLIRTWHPVYAVYDPARTTNKTSSMTGKTVASWVNNRLIIWEASGHLWKPDELINDIFTTDEKYNPVLIGVEQDGLHDFITQPLRQEQVKRGHPIPLRPLKAPKGKDDFISSLQPFFKAHEVIFAGQREDFAELAQQLLAFTPGRNIGRKDIPNALAYFLTLRPGLPVYDDFDMAHIEEDVQISTRHPLYLCVNATNYITTAILAQVYDGVLSCITDYVREGAPGSVLAGVVREVGVYARTKFTLVSPRHHFEAYDTTGLVGAARRIPVAINRGGQETQGREELRTLMQKLSKGRSALRVSTQASWTLRALSGGYARDIGKEEPTSSAYRVLCEGLESFAGTLSSGLRTEEDEGIRYAWTSDGRKFISALPARL